MFVRFRERTNDGREPIGVAATFQCAKRCHPELRNRRAGFGAARYQTGCPLRPRCRWRIDGDLVPYRLLVGLIANRRVNGKIKQEYIADLGAIDGHMLPSFFAGLSPERAHAIRGDLARWYADSISVRSAFWNALEEKLARLGNRINADDAVKIRASIKPRIPKPTADDVAQVEAWLATLEVPGWERLQNDYRHMIDRERKKIAGLEEDIKASRDVIGSVEGLVSNIDHNIHSIQVRLAHGDKTVVEESAKERRKAHLGLGHFWALQVGALKSPK
jgi:hypothetical protein